MHRGELLTRLSVWLALAAAAASLGMQLSRRAWIPGARWAWTVGCAFFVLHVLCAFAYYHAWSHRAAYQETARQTGELTGFYWGGGLFLNYLFAMLWVIDALAWWRAPAGEPRWPRRWLAAWHGFFVFMLFNGTVVFGSGPVRWFGGIVCAMLAWLWWRGRWAGTAR